MKTNSQTVRTYTRLSPGKRVTMTKPGPGSIVRSYQPFRETLRHKLARFTAKSRARAMAR